MQERLPLFVLLAAVLSVTAVVLWPESESTDSLAPEEAQAEGDAEPSLADAAQETLVPPSQPEVDAQREELDPVTAVFAEPFVVTVRDAQGEPAVGRQVAVTSTGVLEIWLIDEGATTGADGRAVFDLARLRRIAETNDWNPVRVGVWEEELRGFEVAQELDLFQASEVSLTLPAIEGIAITLRGFPAGIRPLISPAEGHPSAHLDFSGDRQADGSFLFRRLPVGAEWEVYLEREDTAPQDGGYILPQRLALSTARIPGPATAGERADVELTPADFGLIHGRFVDQAGTPLPVSAVHTGTAVGYGQPETSLQAWALDPSEEGVARDVSIEVFAEGQFLASVSGAKRSANRSSTRSWIDVAKIEEVHFSWQPHERLRRTMRPAALASALAGARQPLAGPTPGKFGDVPLTADGAQLEVRVVDQNGDPVVDAQVICERKWTALMDLGEAGSEPMDDWSRFAGDVHMVTNAEGVARLTAPGWEFPPTFIFRLMKLEAPPEPGDVRVKVMPVDHVPAKVEIPGGTRLTTIQVTRAGSIFGWFRLPGRDPYSFRAAAFPAGADREEVEPLATSEPDHSLDGGFKINNLPAGVADVVVYWSTLRFPVAVFPRVEVRAGETTKPRALQGLDLAARLNWIELTVPESVLDGLEYGYAKISIADPAQPGRQRSAPIFASDDGDWEFPLPLGHQTWTGTFLLDGVREYRARGLPPGRHQLDLQPMAQLELLVDPSLGAYDKDWRLFVRSEAEDAFSARHAEVKVLEGRLVLFLAGAAELSVSWIALANDGTWERVAESTLTVTEQDLSRTQLRLTPPEGFPR